ncbi:MAG TPA: type II toxin-antitoxin system VapC family toxin [Spirochaetota bacterium]|nr:type II toxin-antitoxin system VapC family toxin [Spirochaetota bacterium]HQP47803.1 type II toxin-antitoxin system VapC family toxin [Spirochaetota bacterium]
MNYLLDTHVFLWAIFDDDLLSQSASSIILNQDNTIFVSLISFWEISLKFNTGKLSLHNVFPEELPKYAEKSGFEILNLTPTEVSTSYRLPKLKHKDPFDRLLIWQCINNNICLISKDSELSEYKDHGLQIIW